MTTAIIEEAEELDTYQLTDRDLSLQDLLSENLSHLGSTPDKVAETLEALGHTGRPCSSGYCPLANYLRPLVQEANRGATVFVDGFNVKVFGPLDGDETRNPDYIYGRGLLFEMKMPEAAIEFAIEFDRYEYPELVDWLQEK